MQHRWIMVMSVVALLSGCVDTPPSEDDDTGTEQQPGVTPALPEGLVWKTAAPMDLPTAEHAVASLNETFYIIGGYIIPTPHIPIPDQPAQGAPVPTDRMLIYDAKGDSWTQGTPYPVTLNHAQAVGYDGKVYVFNGGDSYVYDPAAASWSPMADVPANHNAGMAALDGDKIYVAAGRTTEGHIYWPANDTWTKLPAEMAVRRDHTAGAVVGGRLFVVAGDVNGHAVNTDSVEMYDPWVANWTERAPIPVVRGSLSGVSWMGRVVVMGGQSGPDEFDDVNAYDPVTDNWTELPPMPSTRHGFAAGVWEGRIYVFAGAPQAGVTGFTDVHYLDFA